MTKIPTPAFAALVAVVLLLVARAALGQAAGTVEFSVGDVRVRNAAGAERPAPKGTVVSVGESVLTGAQGQAQMRMVDNAFLAVRPDTEVNLSEYRFSGKTDGTENAVLRLVRGTLRAFTGQIASVRRDRFVTTTPTATIGVRGTGNVAFYSPNLGTLNHTIEGSHEVKSVGSQGQQIGTTIVTTPGQTVQVQVGQPPVRVPTPTFLLQAAAVPPAPAGSKPAPGGGGGPAGGQGQGGGAQTQQGDAGQPAAGGTASTATTETRATSTTDTALSTAAPSTSLAAAVAAPVTTPVVTTTVTGTSSSGSLLDLTAGTATSGTGTTTTIASGGANLSPLVFGPGASVAFLGSTSSSTSSGSSPFTQGFSPNQAFAHTNDFDAFTTLTSLDSAGDFLGAKKTIDTNAEVFTISGITAANTSAITTLANGIRFGRYTGSPATASSATVQTTESQNFVFYDSTTGTFKGGTSTHIEDVIGSLHWITGSALAPFPGTGPFTGTATYSSFSGAVTDQNNNLGTINSALLSANFDRQSVSTSLNMTVGGYNWVATANNLSLEFEHFSARTSNTGASAVGHSMGLTLNGPATGNSPTPVTSTGSPIFGFGSIEGRFTGNLMSGVAESFAFNAMSSGPSGPTLVAAANGVVGFSSPSFSVAPSASTPYQIMVSARGTNRGVDPATSTLSTTFAAQTQPDDFLTRNSIVLQNPSRNTFDTQGGLTQFDAEGLASDASGATETPSRVSTVAGGTPANGGIPAMPAITGTPAALVADSFFKDPTSGVLNTGLTVGKDPVTGITWGRYDNNNFAVVSRLSGNTVSSGINFGMINHYLLTPSQSGPTLLPTGTVTYILVGGTSPTDNQGNVGTLNSATLVGNFAAQRVDATVSATVGPRTWSASASGIPILAGTAFEAQKSIGGGAMPVGTMSVGCSGTGCNPNVTAGSITGVFTGTTTTTQGGGFAYTLNSGGLPTNGGVTAGGVAVFRK